MCVAVGCNLLQCLSCAIRKSLSVHILKKNLCLCSFLNKMSMLVQILSKKYHFVWQTKSLSVQSLSEKKHLSQNVFERRGDQRGRVTRNESKRKWRMGGTVHTRRERPRQACHASACHCVQVQVWQCLMGLAKWVECVESVECVEYIGQVRLVHMPLAFHPPTKEEEPKTKGAKNRRGSDGRRWYTCCSPQGAWL